MKMLPFLLFLFLRLCHGLPAGFITFFSASRTSCPTGWSPVYSGRLVVSVIDGSAVGVTVNEPLSDEEDRLHTHQLIATTTLTPKSITAIGGGNTQGAHNGVYNITGKVEKTSSNLPFTQLLLCQLNKANNNPVPVGTIGYFGPPYTECPDKWVVYGDSTGRVLVPGWKPSGTYLSPDPPLKSGEDRLHKHTYSHNYLPTDTSYSAIEGCCFNSLSGFHRLNATGATATSQAEHVGSSGLPYVQLLTCTSTAQTFDYNVPVGTLLFNEIKCPENWTVAVSLSGRFLVSLPPYAVKTGAEFGSAHALLPTATETRVHRHNFTGGYQTNAAGVALLHGLDAPGYVANMYYDTSGHLDAETTGLPYLEVPLCVHLPLPLEKQ